MERIVMIKIKEIPMGDSVGIELSNHLIQLGEKVGQSSEICGGIANMIAAKVDIIVDEVQKDLENIAMKSGSSMKIYKPRKQ